MTQKKLISRLLENHKGWVVGSLGSISKDLPDAPNVVKVKGSMGLAISIGLGMALATQGNIKVIIGDGSYLMKLGSMATVLAHKPKNLEIIVLDNGKYASCGGQKTNFKYINKYLRFPMVKVIKVWKYLLVNQIEK